MRMAHQTIAPLVAVVAMVSAGSAFADEELAVTASDVHHEFCAEIYSGNVTLVAEGYREVATTWENVDKEYGETGDIVLLYWRGLLAQCLGQGELAREDLTTFVESQDKEQQNKLRMMTADAKKRLNRMQAVEDGAVRKRRRIVALGFSVGPAIGPYATEQIEAYAVADGESAKTEWLGMSVQLRVQLGIELRVYKPLVWGLMIGMTTGTITKVGETYIDAAAVLEDSRSSDPVTVIDHKFTPWIEAQTWFGMRFLPAKQVSPVARVGFTFGAQQQGDPKIEPWGKTSGWPMLNVAGYMGCIIDSPKVVGVDIGVWVGTNTFSGLRSDSALEGVSESFMLSRADGGSTRVMINPRVALRLNL